MNNKFILLLILSLLVAVPFLYSADIQIKEFVNDYADIINPDEEKQLDSILQNIYDSGIAQYSIVTVKSLEGKDIESYSLDLAQGNLGDSEKNNGLLLLVALDDRKYRFEVGRGLEYILNDAKVGRIGRTYLVPNFQSGDYGRGIVEASQAVKSILLNETDSEYAINDCVCAEDEILIEKTVSGRYECSCAKLSDVLPFIIISFVIFIGIFGLVIFLIVKASKSKNKYFNAATGALILFGGGRGGRGGFGGSGGFGGFGGGGFGGGGASGGW